MKKLALIFYFFISFNAYSEVKIIDHVRYYHISALTGTELHHQIKINGPRINKEGKALAATKWTIESNGQFKFNGRQCEISNLVTVADITILYPRWVNKDSADELLRQSWDKIYAVMQKHELIHRQHGVDAANEVDLAIMSISSAKDCNLLSNNSKTTAKLIIDKYHKLDEDLDRTEPPVIADDKFGFVFPL